VPVDLVTLFAQTNPGLFEGRTNVETAASAIWAGDDGKVLSQSSARPLGLSQAPAPPVEEKEPAGIV
jgi:hypothetical protein